MGVPALIVALADNQQGIATALNAIGACRALPGPVDPDGLADAIAALADDRSLRQSLSEAGQKLVDGQGAGRVAGLMREDSCAC